jgi:hypothetical protein
MPAIYDSSARAYHGAEPGIIGGLLFHLIKQGVDRGALHAELQSKITTKKIMYGGNFADYGDNDGEREATRLRLELEELSQSYRSETSVLFESIVDAYSTERFSLNSLESGVSFMMAQGNKVVEEMRLPNEEITDYIVTLVASGGGRTSPVAMLRSIEALVGDKIK